MVLGENLKFFNRGVGGHGGTTITIYDQAANLGPNGISKVRDFLSWVLLMRSLCDM